MIKNKLKPKYIFPVFLLPLLILAAACNQTTMPSIDDDALLSENPFVSSPFNLQNAKVNGSVAAQLAEVRRVTAPYHNTDKAQADGWVVSLSPCVVHPTDGGMGYHYGNPEYLTNGVLDPLMPEVLLYEPQKNGKFRLVGVEYIVPFGAPENDELDSPVKGDRPTLFGQYFDDSPHVGPNGSWTLHVWLWRNNPSGMFAAFNPNVTCDHAP